MSEPVSRVKIVLVGDHNTRKYEFAVVWLRRQGSEHFAYIPSIIDDITAHVRVGDQQLVVRLSDTTGQEDLENIMALSYVSADIFLLFFLYDSVESLNNIRTKWVPDITSHCPNPLFILVGVRTHVIEDYQVHEAVGESPFVDTPVSDELVREVMAEIGAADFIDCCPLINHRVQEVVERALQIFIEKDLKKHKRKWWQIKQKGKKGGE